MGIDRSENLLNEIGKLLTEDREYPFKPTILYAEVNQNVVGESIFKDLGSHIIFRLPIIDRLPYALLDLWEIQGENNRWIEMEYVLRDGKFEVTYFYRDDIDPEEDLTERRNRSVERHFGHKPIVYPSLNDDVPDYIL